AGYAGHGGAPPGSRLTDHHNYYASVVVRLPTVPNYHASCVVGVTSRSYGPGYQPTYAEDRDVMRRPHADRQRRRALEGPTGTRRTPGPVVTNANELDTTAVEGVAVVSMRERHLAVSHWLLQA